MTGILQEIDCTLDNYGLHYSNVNLVRHKVTGEVRSMKVIAKNIIKGGFTEEEIEREINILKLLDHPNIIKLYEFYSDKDFYYLVSEFCNEGNLGQKLIQVKKFDECIVKILMFQIFSAVLYLHSKNIIHGDLVSDFSFYVKRIEALKLT